MLAVRSSEFGGIVKDGACDPDLLAEKVGGEDEELPFLKALFLVEHRAAVCEIIVKDGATVADLSTAMEKDEYLQENAKSAKPMSIFADPEKLFSASSQAAKASATTGPQDIMKATTDALADVKQCAKSLKRSCEDLKKLKRNLDKARAQYQHRKQMADKSLEDATTPMSTGRTSWAKLLTSDDFPVFGLARGLMSSRPVTILSGKDVGSDSCSSASRPLVLRKGGPIR